MTYKRYLINLETGELTDALEEGDSILRNGSKEHLKSRSTIPMKSFVKLNSDELARVMPELTTNERAVFITMIPYVSYMSCCLTYKNGVNIELEDIAKLSFSSRATTIKAVESLVKKNIFYKGKNGKGNQYFVNPWLVNKGMTIDSVLKEMFKHYRIRSKGGVKWENLQE